MCKAKHKLAFFQWREMYVASADVVILKDSFESMVKFADYNNKGLNKMIKEAEKHKIKLAHEELKKAKSNRRISMKHKK